MTQLEVELLTRQAFAPFGEIIACDGADHFAINDGTTERYHDLANIDVTAGGGRALVSIFRGRPRRFPFEISMVERHPLGSQAFMPLGSEPYLVVVARAGDAPRADDLRVFLAAPDQGVNYARNVWHHPLIALNRQSDFLVVDRGGPGDNLEECELAGTAPVIVAPAVADEQKGQGR